MRILIVGSGGREHALAYHLAVRESNQVYCAPGNPGTAAIAQNVDVSSDDIDGLLALASRENIDLTVVGPEGPLVDGIVDRFRASGLAIVGPTAAAARLEGSKAFSKAFMERHGIPTAGFRTFARHEVGEAISFIEQTGAPIVVKASGLAAGKGAVVCETIADAVSTVRSMLDGNAFGEASDSIVIEEFMDGEEASLFALCDGRDYVLLSTAQDHKRIGEGDTGPNTGGMGAYAPAPVVTPEVLTAVQASIIEPTLRGMADEGMPYSGYLYVGLMIDRSGSARVVEYNCRMGDPETQVVLTLIDDDFTDLLFRSATNNLSGRTAALSTDSAAVVVIASNGYPGSYEKGKVITGLEQLSALPGVTAYHAGTRLHDGSIVTNGGRVLGITGQGSDLKTALTVAYNAVDHVAFDGMVYRRDIGQRGLNR